MSSSSACTAGVFYIKSSLSTGAVIVLNEALECHLVQIPFLGGERETVGSVLNLILKCAWPLMSLAETCYFLCSPPCIFVSSMTAASGMDYRGVNFVNMNFLPYVSYRAIPSYCTGITVFETW